MILAFEDRFFVTQNLHQSAAPDFVTEDIDHEAVAFPLADEFVERGEHLFRDDKMCALLSHGHVPSCCVPDTLYRDTASVKRKTEAHLLGTTMLLRPITSFMGLHNSD